MVDSSDPSPRPSPGGRGRSSGVTCPLIFYAEHWSVGPNRRGARLDRPPKMDPGVRAHSWWMSAGSWTRLEVHVRPGSFDFAFDFALDVAFDFDSPDPERTLM